MIESRPVYFSPHAVSGESVQRIMAFVCIALVPSIILSILFYGYTALIQYIVGTVSCVFFEWIFCLFLRRPSSIKDGSAVVTGLLLVMTLPPFIPLWMTVIGSFISVVVGKMVFGGLGQNPFNPALVGRTALLMSFPHHMTSWSQAGQTIFTEGFFIDSVSGATVLGLAKDSYTSDTVQMIPSIFNNSFTMSGSLGEISALALLLGGLFLIYKQVISWRIPVYFIGTVFLLSSIIWLFNRGTVMDPVTQILSGGLFLGAFFMATDYSSSPLHNRGKVIFAIGCGVITVLIRLYGGYPEGVGFAILIMNAFVPLLDRYFKPVPFGMRYE